jgi:peptidoglycan LD-endopeptidase LytH
VHRWSTPDPHDPPPGDATQPLPGAPLHDSFGQPRGHGRHHEGIDIFAARGTDVHAVSGGTVVRGFDDPLGGVVVRIEGEDGRYYYYAHLEPGSTGQIHVGQEVRAGEVIGRVGTSGNAAGGSPHLHFQVREDGDWIDPYPFLREISGDGGQGGRAAGAVSAYAMATGDPAPTADADGDGLTDVFEKMFGTSVREVDSDHDHLSDAYESAVAHTDPHLPDTDHDGLDDGTELLHGTDPGTALPHLVDPVAAADLPGQGWPGVDSDHDHLSDAYESAVAHTDPHLPDTDHDGLDDGTELLHGTDPGQGDSDGDGLTDAFELTHPLADLG